MKVRIFDNTPDEVAKIEFNQSNGMIHSLDRIYVLMCIRGSGRFFTTFGEEFFITPQNYILVHKRDFRFDQKSSDFRLRIIQVEKEFLHHLLDPEFRQGLNKLFSRPRMLHVGKNQFELYEKVTRFLRITIHNYDNIEYKREIIEGYLKVFTYTSLLDLEMLGTYDSRGYNSKRENTVSDRFMDLVRTHCREERGLQYYANRLGMSPRNLSLLVMKSTGRHASEWIDEYVMEEIKRSLVHSDISVQSISYEMNFSNPSHLIKFFKKNTGVTPREYRLSYQKSSNMEENQFSR